MQKYYLIYNYHDTYFIEFNTLYDLTCYLDDLLSFYKYDSDFSYKIIHGFELKK